MLYFPSHVFCPRRNAAPVNIQSPGAVLHDVLRDRAGERLAAQPPILNGWLEGGSETVRDRLPTLDAQ